MTNQTKSRLFLPVFLSIALLSVLTWKIGTALYQYQLNHALWDAVSTNDAASAGFLLDQGADPNDVRMAPSLSVRETVLAWLQSLRGQKRQEQTPMSLLSLALIFQFHRDDCGVVKSLVEHGARTEALFPGEFSPLIEAAGTGKAEAVQVLLAHGANVNAVGENGATALYAAVQSGSIETVNVLLAGGAKVSVKDQQGATALSLAEAAAVYEQSHLTARGLRYSHAAIVRILKQAGAKE